MPQPAILIALDIPKAKNVRNIHLASKGRSQKGLGTHGLWDVPQTTKETFQTSAKTGFISPGYCTEYVHHAYTSRLT